MIAEADLHDFFSHTLNLWQTEYMKKLIAIFCLIVAVLIGNGGVGYAQDSNKGWLAVKKGDYATAFREWRPLAE